MEERLSDAASLIFTAHLLILKDRAFLGAIEERMAKEENAAKALIMVAENYIKTFSRSSNLYIREKALDMEDPTVRIMGNLTSNPDDRATGKDHVVIARELFPSDLLKMSSEGVSGIVVVSGGVTSHLSILARSLQIPLLIVDEPLLLSLPEKTPVLLDGELGNIYIKPSEDVVSSFRRKHEGEDRESGYAHPIGSSTCTRDGERVRLLANFNLIADLKPAGDFQCEGIGLYRSEFPFIKRDRRCQART